MGTTRAALRASLRQTLNDLSAWPDPALNQWIDEAVLDYSNSFRLHREAGFPARSGENLYELNMGGRAVFEVLAVEYPVGYPRQYLARIERSSPRFYQEKAYDIFYDGQSERAWMLISFLPPKDEPGNFWITYQTLHPLPTGDEAVLTVPDLHLEALRLFVIWKALQKLEGSQAVESVGGIATPDFLPVLSALGLSATRAGQLYRAKIHELNRQKSDGSIVSWGGSGRVY
jgi:hypothetical protein